MLFDPVQYPTWAQAEHDGTLEELKSIVTEDMARFPDEPAPPVFSDALLSHMRGD